MIAFGRRMTGGVLLALAVRVAPAQAPASRTPGRLVGVFDDVSGQPIADAEVVDMLTGWSAKTTATGTLTLFYVDSGGTLLRIRKVGYLSQTFPVRNSRRDTIPITVTLKPAGQVLPAARTTARGSRGPADTVRKLELAGFYERRNTQGAPLAAFVPAEKIEKLTLVSDVAYATGRGICKENLYIDGVLVKPLVINKAFRTTKVLKDGVDAMLDPSAIAGMEMYTHMGEIPTEFNRTLDNGMAPGCATLIWTK